MALLCNREETMKRKLSMILAGDIGGTKTHLALFDKNKRKVREEKFPSKDHSSLEEIVSTFLKGEKVEKACFGIAGPVQNNTVRTTNLPWNVNAKNFSIPNVRLLNDLESNAYGLFELKEDQLYCISEGKTEFDGNRALVSAGTGLGEAGLFFDGKKHHPFSCEGGHVDFGPRNELEIELLRFLIKKFGHVSSERILSGPGIYNIYSFFVEKGGLAKDQEVEAAPEGERPKVISDRGCEKKSEICVKTLELFVELYGAEAGNCALKFMAYGGVYLGGGIAPKIKPLMTGGLFMKGFKEKGRFEKIMDSLPVHIVLEQETALLGSMHYAMQRM